MALVATVAASAMASLDATVVNVALPDIGKEFGASVSTLQWVLTGYLIALASLILLGGALGDRFGRRKVFIIGTAWFAAASLLCGLAPGIEFLVVARVLQGVGGALLTPGQPGDPAGELPGVGSCRCRRRVVRTWRCGAGPSGRSSAAGLVDGPGWRWAFLVNVPVAVVAIACARAAVPESRDSTEHRRLDLIGATLAVVGLATGTWAFTAAGDRGWSDPAVIGPLAISVVAIVGLVRRILRARDPLVPPALFQNRTFTVLNMATVLVVRTARCVVLPHRLRAAGRSGLVGARGRRRADAGNGPDARLLGTVGRARAADRTTPATHGRARW